ncbi:helix-turn-helix domain-containing protein [Treponema sp.]|uniref:helix-turn-helix domain-containing protein n=1 Tax=Treponema sp. TaxID=166 RepID=UPI003FA2A0A8
MNTLHERIKILRKHLGYNQEEFSEKIGLKRAALSLIEIGKNSLTESNIRLICMTFDVSREWLETGTGKMLDPDTAEDREFLSLYKKLSPEIKGVVFDHVKALYKIEKKKKKDANIENELKEDKDE